MENCSARIVVHGPEPATVGLNNGSADTKPHTGAVFLGGEESIEYLAGLVRRKSDTSVFDRYQKVFIAMILGAERELTRAIDGLHCVDDVDHQVQYLLQLDAVCHNERLVSCKPCLYRNRVLDRLVVQKNLHLSNHLVNIDALLGHDAFSEKQPDPVNDFRCSVCITNYQ